MFSSFFSETVSFSPLILSSTSVSPSYFSDKAFIETFLPNCSFIQCPAFGKGIFIRLQIFLSPLSEMKYFFESVSNGVDDTRSYNCFREIVSLFRICSHIINYLMSQSSQSFQPLPSYVISGSIGINEARLL